MINANQKHAFDMEHAIQLFKVDALRDHRERDQHVAIAIASVRFSTEKSIRARKMDIAQRLKIAWSAIFTHHRVRTIKYGTLLLWLHFYSFFSGKKSFRVGTANSSAGRTRHSASGSWTMLRSAAGTFFKGICARTSGFCSRR